MRWIHFSNLGFGSSSANVETMREEFLKLAERVPHADCLFLTGNIWEKNVESNQHMKAAISYLQETRSRFQIPKERTFLVSGNQDMQQSTVSQYVIKGELRHYSTDIGVITLDSLNIVRESRRNFLELYQEVCGREEPDWHYAFPVDGFNVICLNTDILNDGNEESGNLVVGRNLIRRMSGTVEKKQPGIVLACHDFSCLLREEAEALEVALKDLGATLYLCGTTNGALNHTQMEMRADKPLQVFANRKLRPQSAEPSQMEVYAGEIFPDGTGYAQGYSWSTRRLAWTLDTELSYLQGGENDGRYYFPYRETRNHSNLGRTPLKSADAKSSRLYQTLGDSMSEESYQAMPFPSPKCEDTLLEKDHATEKERSVRDFFVSYNNAHDGARAAWIARTLRENGYTVHFQDEDCLLGTVFPQWMADALAHSRAFIAVWSKAYEDSAYCRDELNAAYVRTHQDSSFRLLPVRAEDVPIQNPLVAGIVHANVFSPDEAKNRKELLNAVQKVWQKAAIEYGASDS